MSSESAVKSSAAVKLSVNVNKVATVRNSRGGSIPSVIEAVRTCIDAGAPGITVHPRADQRHITTADVHEIADELAPLKGRVEFNIEGDPRPGFLDLVLAVKPDQCTLVPVKPGEITSEAGWPADTPADALAGIVGALKANGVRVSLFVDPEPAAIAGPGPWAPIASSCIPSHSRGRSSADLTRRRQASRSMPPHRTLHSTWASASTPGTISI